jgi:DNA-binding beta-propeller fold protein YncE
MVTGDNRHLGTFQQLCRGAFLLISLANPALPAGYHLSAVAGGEKNVLINVEIEPSGQLRGNPGTLLAGTSVSVRFRLFDAATRTPLGGAHPAGWLALNKDGYSPDACPGLVQTLSSGGSILNRAETDLNDYFVLTLNEDASIHVVDPLFGYAQSKLLAMVPLKTPGVDWALTPDQNRLFVSMPASSQVSVVDTVSWRVIRLLDTAPNPQKVAIQPDGEYLWVSTDSGAEVFSTRTLQRVNRFTESRGNGGIAFSNDNHYTFLADSERGVVLVAATGKKYRTVKTGGSPVSVAYSALSRAAYLSDPTNGAIVVVDPERNEPVARLQAETGLGPVRMGPAPYDRFGFALNPSRNLLHIFNTVTNRMLRTIEIPGKPIQIAFSDKLAYVLQRDSEMVLMIPLDVVDKVEGSVHIADFPAGGRPFGDEMRASLADKIVQAPGENAVLVANPSDRAVYYYSEGMAAPMGHFDNKPHQPLAVLVVNRSLTEIKTGQYETTAQLGKPGRYTLAFVMDSPPVVHCFENVVIAPNPTIKATVLTSSVRAEPLPAAGPIHAGETVRLRFRLTDPVTRRPKIGVQDLRILTYLVSGTNQSRDWAKPEKEGIYAIDFTPDEPGIFRFSAGSDSLKLRFGDSPYGTFEVLAPKGN